MLKQLILVLFYCLLFSAVISNADELIETTSQSVIEQTTMSTTTTATTTTTMTTTDLLAKTNISNVLVDSKSSVMVKEKTVANFAQYNGKLLVNQTAESSMNGRIITAHSNNNGVTAVSTGNGLSVAVIIALIAIVTVVVSAIIISAVFVMKRRFSIWRLNGDSSSDSKATGTEETKEATDINAKEQTEVKCVEVNEKDPEVAKQVAMAADQPVSVNVENAQAVTESVSESKPNELQQASPSSSSPLIEKTNEEAESNNQLVSEPVELNKEQVTSSSSLIVNVLNELSESVACKLANAANSPAAKSTHSNTVETTETQPLNKDE